MRNLKRIPFFSLPCLLRCSTTFTPFSLAQSFLHTLCLLLNVYSICIDFLTYLSLSLPWQEVTSPILIIKLSVLFKELAHLADEWTPCGGWRGKRICHFLFFRPHTFACCLCTKVVRGPCVSASDSFLAQTGVSCSNPRITLRTLCTQLYLCGLKGGWINVVTIFLLNVFIMF